MPNADRECNSQRSAIETTEKPDISRDLPKSAPNSGYPANAWVSEGNSVNAGLIDSRSDWSHLPNRIRSVSVNSSMRRGSQSKFAHHSTKARSPSTMGVIRNVA
jgi:hypothetical protein